MNGEDYHNEQVGNWIADANSDGEVTLKEAFTYADEIEYHLPNHSNPVHGTTKQSVYNVITLCNKSYNCYNNGTFLPQEITSNMTLTSDYYGYVEIVVKSGATRK